MTLSQIEIGSITFFFGEQAINDQYYIYSHEADYSQNFVPETPYHPQPQIHSHQLPFFQSPSELSIIPLESSDSVFLSSPPGSSPRIDEHEVIEDYSGVK